MTSERMLVNDARLSMAPATPADIVFVEWLTRSNMAAYRAARQIAWDPARFLDSWHRFESRLILADGGRVGVLQLFEVDGALEIRDLQLVPGFQGRGIGSWALAQVQSEALARDIGTLRLRVFVENPAQRLYLRLGFRVEAVIDGTIHMARCA